MTNRLILVNSSNGILFGKPQADQRGDVKKAGWGIPIRINGRWVNRNSLINFINSRMEPTDSILKKGCFGVSNKQIRIALEIVLKEKVKLPVVTPVNVPSMISTSKPDENPVIEKPFIEKLSKRQISLYQSLKRPRERDLYEHLYHLGGAEHHPGIFGDLLISLIKGTVLDFQMNGNDIILNLMKGKTSRKLLGFELKGTFPTQISLRFDPEMKKLSFINGKIPFTYLFLDIFSPRAVTLTSQGALIQADFGDVAKTRDEVKQFERPLNNDQIFRLFD